MRWLLLLVSVVLLGGCVSVPTLRDDDASMLPPVMRADELGNRTYRTVGRIQVHRTVYITDYAVSPNLQEWGMHALREEGQKLAADAVIFAEVTSREHTVSGFPTFPATEYWARGVAIKFIAP